jgi:FMN phosphatase YigB (HAD superfamily)
VSHRKASQHTRLRKQVGTSRLVRSTGKPEKIFYDLVVVAAGCPASQVLFVGDNLACDVAAPVAHGMRAALVRPQGLRPGEKLPAGAVLIRHVRELPALLETA